MECGEVREHLSAFDDKTAPINEISIHLDSCASCRAEQERYRQLQKAMAALETTLIEPPAWLLGALTERTLERMRRTAAIKATGRQIGEHRVAAGGAAILLAGLAGAVVVGRSRRRRTRRLRLAGLATA
jgi:hypothetical protein